MEVLKKNRIETLKPMRKQIREYTKVISECREDLISHIKLYDTYKHDNEAMLKFSLERMKQSRVSKSQYDSVMGGTGETDPRTGKAEKQRTEARRNRTTGRTCPSTSFRNPSTTSSG